MGRANVAAAFMEHLCNCEAHGYSWAERQGDPARGTCTVECEGVAGIFYKGDRDCSSAIIDAWSEALEGTPWAGCLNGATYTGNMRSVFVASGLFEWKPMSFIAQRGDIYLSEANHTAMCVSGSPDLLAEFSISETGGTTGQSGDQTGWESHVCGYYDYPWDGILHYNGKADGGGAGAPAAPAASAIEIPEAVRRIRVWIREHGWLEWVSAKGCEDGCGDLFAGIPGCWIYGVESRNCGTLTVERADGTRDGGGPGDSPVTGIHLTRADYKVHWLGAAPGWGKVEHNDDDDGAGKDAQSPLDMIRLMN